MDAFSERLSEERQNAQRVQENTAFGFARISPVTSYSLIASSLAGTSIGLKNRFYDEAWNYQKSYGNFIKEKTGMNVGGGLRVEASTSCSGGGDDKDKKPELIDPHELPVFKFANHDLGRSVNAAVIDMGILSIFNIIFFAGAFIAFARYDVR